MTRPSNIDRVRAVIGDLPGLFDLFDEEIVWDMRGYRRETLPDFTGTRSGRDEVIALIRRYLGAWADYRFEVEELIEAGDSVVLVTRETGRGRTSGVPMEHRQCQVWTFRDGRIVHAASYSDRAAAFEALGQPRGAQ